MPLRISILSLFIVFLSACSMPTTPATGPDPVLADVDAALIPCDEWQAIYAVRCVVGIEPNAKPPKLHAVWRDTAVFNQVTPNDHLTMKARPLIRSVVDSFPESLLRRGAVGSAVVAFVVERNGKVGKAVVLAANDDQFGTFAWQSVIHWKFQPAESNGVPVRSVVVQPLVFSR